VRGIHGRNIFTTAAAAAKHRHALEESLAAWVLLVEGWVTPRGDDLDLGLQRVVGQLKTDLVIALAGGTCGCCYCCCLLMLQ